MAKTYERKTYDIWRIFQNFGYGNGWEEVNTETTLKAGNASLREYRENQPGYPLRMRKGRERIGA
jgi:hypothetical protein